MAKEMASARERTLENGAAGGGGGDCSGFDDDDSDGEERFEAPGDDEAPVRELALVPAGESKDLDPSQRKCPLRQQGVPQIVTPLAVLLDSFWLIFWRRNRCAGS